jgi:hypothetical protein
MSFILLGILNSQVAGVGAGAYDLLETQILDSDTASVTFTGLDTLAAGYQHLQLRVLARESSSATGFTNSEMTFNSDTGSNYSWHYLRGTGSSASSTGASSQSNIRLQGLATGNSSTSGSFGMAVIDILDFSSTSKNTTVRALHGALTATNTHVLITSGAYYETGAITSLNFAIGANDFVAGSRFSLYGVK